VCCAESSKTSFAGTDSISLKKIVDMFYDKVLADAELAAFFENIDMQKLKKHQVCSMATLFMCWHGRQAAVVRPVAAVLVPAAAVLCALCCLLMAQCVVSAEVAG
jgi:hypothetical protein